VSLEKKDPSIISNGPAVKTLNHGATIGYVFRQLQAYGLAPSKLGQNA